MSELCSNQIQRAFLALSEKNAFYFTKTGQEQFKKLSRILNKEVCEPVVKTNVKLVKKPKLFQTNYSKNREYHINNIVAKTNLKAKQSSNEESFFFDILKNVESDEHPYIRGQRRAAAIYFGIGRAQLGGITARLKREIKTVEQFKVYLSALRGNLPQ